MYITPSVNLRKLGKIIDCYVRTEGLLCSKFYLDQKELLC